MKHLTDEANEKRKAISERVAVLQAKLATEDDEFAAEELYLLTD